jgi:hypothetical protein
MVDPKASQARPTPRHPLPVRPDAGRRQRRPRTTGHVDRLSPREAAHHTELLQGPARRGQCGGSAADTGGPSVRTPGHTKRLDAGRVDAGRPLDRLDAPSHGGLGTQTRQRPAWPASGHPRDRRPPGGRPDSPGSRRLGALGYPERLRGDGTCAAALTSAAIGRLPSTAQHEAAPRRTAVVCWSWRVRGEGNGTTER